MRKVAYEEEQAITKEGEALAEELSTTELPAEEEPYRPSCPECGGPGSLCGPSKNPGESEYCCFECGHVFYVPDPPRCPQCGNVSKFYGNDSPDGTETYICLVCRTTFDVPTVVTDASGQAYIPGTEPDISARCQAPSLAIARLRSLTAYMQRRREVTLDEDEYKLIKSTTGLSAGQIDKTIDHMLEAGQAKLYTEGARIILAFVELEGPGPDDPGEPGEEGPAGQAPICPDCNVACQAIYDPSDEQAPPTWVCRECGWVCPQVLEDPATSEEE